MAGSWFLSASADYQVSINAASLGLELIAMGDPASVT